MSKTILFKVERLIYVLLAIIFFVQIFLQKQLIDVYYFLNYFGLADNIFDIMMSLVYLVAIILLLGILFSFLNKINIVKGVTKNTIILKLITEYARFFIVFFPTWIMFSFFNRGLDLSSPNIDLATFLNIYLFWYLVSRVFFQPQIAPEFGLEKEEKDGLI